MHTMRSFNPNWISVSINWPLSDNINHEWAIYWGIYVNVVNADVYNTGINLSNCNRELLKVQAV